MNPTFGSLFAGIGGFDLGLERAGWKSAWQVENDEFCQQVLAKNWPDVPRWGDVRTFDPVGWPAPTLICGGFPCQDLSPVGRRAGIVGKRSGLWAEFARIVRELRPDYVLVENVPGLLVRGMGRVLGDLAAIGYDAEWDCIPAAALGAPHLRGRIFLLAYSRSGRHRIPQEPIFAGRGEPEPCAWWQTEPRLDRVADGLSGRLEQHRRSRSRALGNAVVPQVAEYIGRRLMERVA